VDPSGPKSDWFSDPSHRGLYHGLIRIPGATPGDYLVRIGDIVTKNLTVKDVGTPVLPLTLGYEDDNYSDNGYYSHDDGTEDQCKNVGPAEVRITIFRGVAPPPPESTFDFNLAWGPGSLDPNGFPLNPQWTFQGRPENHDQIPSTSLCHNFSKVDDIVSAGGAAHVVLGPYFSDCTDQTDMNRLDSGQDVTGFLCGFRGGNSFLGHLNWFPVTVEGRAAWGDHSSWLFPIGDNDYTFGFEFHDAHCEKGSTDRSGNRLSVNGHCGLHTEFDASETIEHFHSKPWKTLRDAVESWTNAMAAEGSCALHFCSSEQIAAYDKEIADWKETIQSEFKGDTILTGMFGLDGEHNLKAELHPLYAMATKLDSQTTTNEEVWLIFVRNFGDEGYCSHRNWEVPFMRYTFRLPWRAGMQSVEPIWGANDSEFEGTDGTTGPVVSFVPQGLPDAGVYVTFTLPPPSQRPLIDGALHLKWKKRVVFSNGDDLETDEVENRFREAESKLSPAQLRALSGARILERRDLHPLPPSGPAQKLTQPPPFPP
jgi:hypothetical protein